MSCFQKISQDEFLALKIFDKFCLHLSWQVFLGDPHRCTCTTFMKEKDLCKHICWILLKKFRVPRSNPSETFLLEETFLIDCWAVEQSQWSSTGHNQCNKLSSFLLLHESMCSLSQPLCNGVILSCGFWLKSHMRYNLQFPGSLDSWRGKSMKFSKGLLRRKLGHHTGRGRWPKKPKRTRVLVKMVLYSPWF